MGIQYGRVLLGGLLAGLIINLFEFVAGTYFFAQSWADAMRALGKTGDYTFMQIAAFQIWGFAIGIVSVWLYAAIRPRFGAGPKTAAIAGFAVWLVGYFLSIIPPVVLELFPAPLMAAGAAVGLVEMVIGAIAGGWVYYEPAAAEPQARVAAI